MLNRLTVASAVAFATLTLACAAPVAAAYPDKPIRIVVSFSPGGGTDILARQLAASVAESEKWNVVVENRPGGNGAIALASTARAPVDGYQVVLALRENMVIAPLLNTENQSFDPLKDFTAIANVASAPMVVVAGMNSKYDSIQKALAAAQADPGALRFGTSGQGSMSHLLLAMLGAQAKAPMTHVPYRGSNPAMTDLVGGHVDLVGGSIASGKSFIDGKRVRALAVSSLKRMPNLAEVPTIAELGYPGFDVVTWYGLFGPADLPRDIVEKLNGAVNKVLRTPDMQRTLLEQGMVTQVGSAADFDKMYRDDYVTLGAQIKTLGMTAE